MLHNKLDVKYMDIPYMYISFPEDMQKLVKRIADLKAKNPEVNIGDTVGDLLNIELNYFAGLEGIGKKYVDVLYKMQNDISLIIPSIEKSYVESCVEIDDEEKFYSQPIYFFSRKPEYEKLIKRILAINSDPFNMFHIEETVRGVATLDVNKFSHVVGIGAKYVKRLQELKEEIPELAKSYINNKRVEKRVEDNQVRQPNITIDLSKYYFNRSALNKGDIKLLNKLEKQYNEMDVAAFFSVEGMIRGAGYGKKNYDVYYDLKKRIDAEIIKIECDGIRLDGERKSIIVNSNYFDISFDELDQILLDDVEEYLFSLTDMHQDIAQSRWGFHHDVETLETIGERNNVVRERIRQLSSKMDKALPHHIRVHPKVLGQNIRENMSSELVAMLPNLRSCFNSNSNFYAFLEILCMEKCGAIQRIQDPDVRLNLLDDFFCNNSSPISESEIIAELSSVQGYSRSLAINSIKILVDKLRLKRVPEGIVPINLPRKVAVAHILLNYKNGLPWKDIAKIVNKHEICKRHINEERLLNSLYSDSEYIYQCDRGVYKNLKYLDIDSIDMSYVFNSILEYFKLSKKTSIHLNDYYHQADSYMKNIDYYNVRHIVRTFGLEYGIYFNGKSGVDAIGLTPNFDRVTQKKLILDIMNKSDSSLTKVEIANRLRSKSVGHASFYLDKMMNAGEVVRVDHMMYTTPEKAFKNVDVDTILLLMDEVLTEEARPTEVDILRLKVNRELNLSYSKYFYLALACHNLNVFGWRKANTLLSCVPIEFSNLAEAVSVVCDLNLDVSSNIEALQEKISITREVACSAINYWSAAVAKK